MTRFRDQHFTFSAMVRAEVLAPWNTVRLVVHVHREDTTNGFYDNMANRPIVSAEWTRYEISGDVAPDAKSIEVGVQLVGSGTAWIDDVSFAVDGGANTEPARPLSTKGLDNLRALARLFGFIRYFHPSDRAAKVDWNQLATVAVRQVEAAQTPDKLAASLQSVFASAAPNVRVFPTGFTPAPFELVATPWAVFWRHLGLGLPQTFVSPYKSERIVVPYSEAAAYLTPFRMDLPGGVTSLVPIALYSPDQAAPVEAALSPLQGVRPTIGQPASPPF